MQLCFRNGRYIASSKINCIYVMIIVKMNDITLSYTHFFGNIVSLRNMITSKTLKS